MSHEKGNTNRLDTSIDNRPLPSPPSPSYDSDQLYNYRYQYFKGEVEKWRNNSPNQSHKKNENVRKVPTHDSHNSMNKENDGGSNQGRDKHHEKPKHRAEERTDKKPKSDSVAQFADNKSFNHKQKDHGAEEGLNCEDMHRGNKRGDHKTNSNDCRSNSKEEKNIFKESSVNSYEPRNRSKEDKTKPKKLEIPPNLNLKENQIDFLRDVQNVLILFSDLKSKIEKLNKDKVGLKEEIKKQSNIAKKCKEDLNEKTANHTQVLNQLNSALQENKSLQKEISEMRQKMKESDSSERLKSETRLKDAEIASMRQKMKELQVDKNVLQEIIKEMIYEKEKAVREGLTKPVEARYETQDEGQMGLGDILHFKYDQLNGSLGFEQEHQGRKMGLMVDGSLHNY